MKRTGRDGFSGGGVGGETTPNISVSFGKFCFNSVKSFLVVSCIKIMLLFYFISLKARVQLCRGSGGSGGEGNTASPLVKVSEKSGAPLLLCFDTAKNHLTQRKL